MQVISLDSLIEGNSEESLREYLSSFICCKNGDVELFLHNNAVENEKRSFSRTFLVIDEENNNDIIGYFTLLIKSFDFTDASGTTRQRLTGNKKASVFNAILIAQLGRADSYKGRVSGKQILDLALENCILVHQTVALRVVCVEYEEKAELIKFYKENDFTLLQKNNNGCLISFVRL
jgi:hypothetical protein